MIIQVMIIIVVYKILLTCCKIGNGERQHGMCN